MALVTFESVAAAADAITKEGGRPSVRAVIAHLGGGSPNQVLPHLNEWKAGRPSIRAADFELDPRIAEIIGELIHKAAEQAARTAEDRASDVSADAEAVAEAGRSAEKRATELEAELASALDQIASLTRASEDAAAAAAIDAKNQGDKISGLQDQLTIEREQAETLKANLTRAEYRLEQIPKLEAEIVRLTPYEKLSAVLETKLEGSEANVADLRKRLETAEKRAEKLAEALESAEQNANKMRIETLNTNERLSLITIEKNNSRTELTRVKEQLISSQDELKELRASEREAQIELKTLRSKVADTPVPKQQ